MEFQKFLHIGLPSHNREKNIQKKTPSKNKCMSVVCQNLEGLDSDLCLIQVNEQPQGSPPLQIMYQLVCSHKAKPLSVLPSRQASLCIGLEKKHTLTHLYKWVSYNEWIPRPAYQSQVSKTWREAKELHRFLLDWESILNTAPLIPFF